MLRFRRILCGVDRCPHRIGTGLKMSGQVAAAGRVGEIRMKAWWLVAGFAALVLLYLIADRVATMVTRWPPTINEAVAPSHCEQFIGLARAAYGNNWRVRLDPRDTTCDREVRAAWERQFLPRETPVDEPRMVVTPPIVQPQTVADGPEANTYCLNMISLAKAKYGGEWKQKLDPVCAAGR